jgi:hypothetical protein
MNARQAHIAVSQVIRIPQLKLIGFCPQVGEDNRQPVLNDFVVMVEDLMGRVHNLREPDDLYKLI